MVLSAPLFAVDPISLDFGHRLDPFFLTQTVRRDFSCLSRFVASRVCLLTCLRVVPRDFPCRSCALLRRLPAGGGTPPTLEATPMQDLPPGGFSSGRPFYPP